MMNRAGSRWLGGLSLSRIYFAWTIYSLAVAAVARYSRIEFVGAVDIPVARTLVALHPHIHFQTYFLLIYAMFPLLALAVVKARDWRGIRELGEHSPRFRQRPLSGMLASLAVFAFMAYLCCFLAPDHFNLSSGGRFMMLLDLAAVSWPTLGLIFGGLSYIAGVFVVLFAFSARSFRRSR